MPGWRMGRNIRNNIYAGGTEGYRHCELFTLHAGPGKYARGENNNHSLSWETEYPGKQGPVLTIWYVLHNRNKIFLIILIKLRRRKQFSLSGKHMNGKQGPSLHIIMLHDRNELILIILRKLRRRKQISWKGTEENMCWCYGKWSAACHRRVVSHNPQRTGACQSHEIFSHDHKYFWRRETQYGEHYLVATSLQIFVCCNSN